MSFLAHADGYSTARAKLVEAYQAGDYSAMRRAARASLEARPDYPGAIFNQALAETLDGDAGAALASLERLTALEVDLGVDANEAFAPLHELEGWPSLLEHIAVLRQPVGTAERAWQLDEAAFIPEGIAVSGETLYLGSIRDGRIVRVDDTAPTLLRSPGSAPGGSIYGMRLEGESLWFLATRTDQYRGNYHGKRDALKKGSTLCELRLSNNYPDAASIGCHPLPIEPDRWQTLGDLILTDEFIYAADQTDGPVYSFDRSSQQWSTVVERGEFVSPQGLVPDASGENLYVADYRGGIYRVRLDGYAAPERLESEASLYGIDGLYRYGDWLIAVQNGITPHRVSAHRLDDDGLTVVESRVLLMNHPDFDEPNLGQVVGDDFYVVANSHWNRFDRENNLPEGLSGPIILKIRLPSD
ncbi:MAG: hypothetical protein QNJ19_10905 [Woeseiaceae bacterium]|nr:hypothetical protein [Woeseiaceae bacterium]